MSVILKHVTNSLWHAFNALYQEKPGYVNKSKLKVLTANIATLFDLYGVEKGLDHYRSTTSLNFIHFKYYLAQEVFSLISTSLELKEIRTLIGKIDEICWLICHKNYKLITNNSNLIYTTDNLHKLFRIFCLLSDFYGIDEQSPAEVVLHSSEALIIVKQLLLSFDMEYNCDKFYDKQLNEPNKNYRFCEFLKLIEFDDYINENMKDLNEIKASLNEAVNEMYLTYIDDVIKKGFLYRRGYLLPTLREYWFVLQPCELSYYKNSSEHQLCGTIQLDSKCIVRPINSTGGKFEKFQKFTIQSDQYGFELGTQDHRSRMQWISAIQLAITYSAGKEGFQRDLVYRRRSQREAERKKLLNYETLKKNQIKETESFRRQLEKEKQARMEAENQAKQLKEIAMVDSRRVAELEDIKITLEKLLKDETQAKRDEEIVRALQARVLAEEWDKREELEKLQEEQRVYLEQERRKREEFEMQQMEKERELRDAEAKLKRLEDERQKLDFELKTARSKILQSEQTKEFLEAKLNAIEPQFYRDGETGIRRAISLSAKQRPIINIDTARAATLRKSHV